MSDNTAVKASLDKILDWSVSEIAEHKAIEELSEIKALNEVCRDICATATEQVAGLKNAAKEAGISLDEIDIEDLLSFTKELFSQQTQVWLVHRVSDGAIQRKLNELSHGSMPQAFQVHIDQLIATFAKPVPVEAIEAAPALDAEKAAEKERNKPPPTNAADVLGWIQSESKNAQNSTGRMQERWAKDFMTSSYAKKALEFATDANAPGKPGHYNNEGGASYFRIDQSMTHICWNWDRVSEELPDANKLLTAEKLYSAYDSCLNDYWGFIEKVGRGLRQKGVANVVGPLFRKHLENHKGYTKTVGDKIIAETKSLDAKKVANVVEWVDKTQNKLDDAIKAAKGQ